jgi:hypothetical protein
VKNFFMIFSSRSAQLTTRQRKHEHREVYSVEPATLYFLDWSEEAITFDREDHLGYILNLGYYPLIVDPIIGNTRLTKVLMDGGSGLNILYAETLDLMGISRSQLRANAAPFHGVVPGQRATPLGQIDLPVCFGTPSNFRWETLTFEVVGFHGTYNAILGRPCYARFMAVSNYTYLKLKMPGPSGIITVGSTYKHTYECDVAYTEYAEALFESAALAADLERLSEGIPDPKRHAGSFEPAEEVKLVPLSPNDPDGKVLKVSAVLNPK